MALDHLFASQGGMCKVIDKEYSIYIPHVTSSVQDLDRAVIQSNQNIHVNQGLSPNSLQ